MRRVHAFEFEDQPWLPRSLRVLVTQALQHMNDGVGVYDDVVPLLTRALRSSRRSHIVDLCSGAGGPWRRLLPKLESEVPDLQVTLTDRYPHDASSLQRQLNGALTYRAESIDAQRVPAELDGVRTMFTGFHHFEPDAAARILSDAASRRVPIAVFEFTRRRWLNVLFAAVAGGLGLPFVVPWLRPFLPTHLLWTYLLPIAPLVYAWDGAVSNLRSYSPDELLAMGADVGATDYTWEAGELTRDGAPLPVTYLLGLPTET